MAEFGEIPHQNSAKQIGVKLVKKAYCNNFGAEQSPAPAGGFITRIIKNIQ